MPWLRLGGAQQDRLVERGTVVASAWSFHLVFRQSSAATTMVPTVLPCSHAFKRDPHPLKMEGPAGMCRITRAVMCELEEDQLHALLMLSMLPGGFTLSAAEEALGMASEFPSSSRGRGLWAGCCVGSRGWSTWSSPCSISHVCGRLVAGLQS